MGYRGSEGVAMAQAGARRSAGSRPAESVGGWLLRSFEHLAARLRLASL